MSSTLHQGRAAGALVRLFRVLARLPTDCPNVLDLYRDQDVAAPILRRLAAGEEPQVTDLRHGVAAVHSLLRDHAAEQGPLLQGPIIGTVDEMRLYLDRRPQGVRRLAAITLLWGSRLSDQAGVNGSRLEVWAERFTSALTGTDTPDAQRTVLAMLSVADALLPDPPPRSAAQAALHALDAQLDELRRAVPTLTSLDVAADLTRRVRRARLLMEPPLTPPPAKYPTSRDAT